MPRRRHLSLASGNIGGWEGGTGKLGPQRASRERRCRRLAARAPRPVTMSHDGDQPGSTRTGGVSYWRAVTVPSAPVGDSLNWAVSNPTEHFQVVSRVVPEAVPVVGGIFVTCVFQECTFVQPPGACVQQMMMLLVA